MGGLGGGDDGGGHGGAYGTGELLSSVADGVAVGFHGLIQHRKAVGEDISYGQSLAGGKEEVAHRKHPGGGGREGAVEEDKGENKEGTSQKHRPFGAESVVNASGHRRKEGAQDAAGKKDASCGEGVFTGNNLGEIGNQKSQGQADELKQRKAQCPQHERTISKGPDIQERPFALLYQFPFPLPEKEKGQQETGKEDSRHEGQFPMAQLRAAHEEAGEGNGQIQEPAGIKGTDADIRRLAHRQAAQNEGNQKQRKHGPENHAPAEEAHNVPADGGSHRRSQGAQQHAGTHHDPQPVQRRLFHDDVKHEGQRNTGPRPLQKTAQKEQQEIRRPGAQKSAQNEKPRRREEKFLHGEPLLQVPRQRNHHRQHQKIARGNPLYQGS